MHEYERSAIISIKITDQTRKLLINRKKIVKQAKPIQTKPQLRILYTEYFPDDTE